MPRGKNYVNNNLGVCLQVPTKKKYSGKMKMCEYGSACNRPDCIYRHDDGGGKTTEEICLPFLAGKCSYDDGCRKRHPSKEVKARLVAKYKRTRCRFGDDCYTEGCLYLHPSEMKDVEPAYIEPTNVAFPPLNGRTLQSKPKAPPNNSAWKAAPPAGVAPSPPASRSNPHPRPHPSNHHNPHPPVTTTGMGQPMMRPPPPPPPPQHHHHHQHPQQSMPAAQPPMWYPPPPMWGPNYEIDPAVYYYEQQQQQQAYHDQYGMMMMAPVPPPYGVVAAPFVPFNAEAKEFIPGNSVQ